MKVTEVRIKLMDEPGDRLKAFCSITLDDCFVIRDLKIIEGTTGPFVAMPSRKLTAHCQKCGSKNHLRATYCNQCGTRQREGRAPKDTEGRAKLYADIAHPINSDCREMIQDSVIHEFQVELDIAKQPGYVSKYDDYDFEDLDIPQTQVATTRTATQAATQAATRTAARVDSSHGTATSSPPHIIAEAKPAEEPTNGGPHFQQQTQQQKKQQQMPQQQNPQQQSDSSETSSGSSDDSFGAGIFPKG